jgi:hypothetical protein
MHTVLTAQQKIKSTAFTSFSVFGLLFTFIVGSLIALTSYLLEPVSRMLYKKWGFQTFAHLEWNTNATLQLQRLAHEQLGFGTWSKGAAEIPVTEADNLLGCLDISNLDHPVLYPPYSHRNTSSKETQTQSSHETAETVETVTLVTSESVTPIRPHQGSELRASGVSIL